MSDRTAPKLPKWPFFIVDAALLGLAYFFYYQSKSPMTPWDMLFCTACVAFGAALCVAPFLQEYRAAMKLAEADRLTKAVLQIENLEIIGRQITHATANWQTAHEHATQSVEAARGIAEGIATEARAFSEFLKKANDTEKNHLRLEVDKLRRAENEWLQILVRILDHIFALYQAAVRAGQANLVEQLGLFQNACRDIARRVGLVAFVAIPGEPYDAKVHQLADANVVPAAEALVAETIATGYSFQGQLVRPALVALQRNNSSDSFASDEFSPPASDGSAGPSTVADASWPNSPESETETEFSTADSEETAPPSTESGESAREFLHPEPPESDREKSRL